MNSDNERDTHLENVGIRRERKYIEISRKSQSENTRKPLMGTFEQVPRLYRS